jgi:hypothetical protein
MPTHSQMRGMLLEEVLLYFLRTSGYKPIDFVDPSDDSLEHSSAGIEVRGRGANHQIDAIAEFSITPPFTYPQRLLIEAKCYSGATGIEIVRNALGVLRDVQEYWVPNNTNVPAKARFHYQYAIFSTSHYTNVAERFAFAQDIYLIPLARTRYFHPIVEKIIEFQRENIEPSMHANGFLHTLRMGIRNILINPKSRELAELELNPVNRELFTSMIQQCRNIGTGVLAILNKRLPVFMVSSPGSNIDDLIRLREINVRIYYNNQGWYIHSSTTDQELFSFDMPNEILNLYLESGIFSPSRALDLKEQILGEIQLIITRNDQTNFITLRLDQDWLNGIRHRLQLGERHQNFNNNG